MMHDDEIVGFLTPPPEDFPEAPLRGWMFYPDGSLNLSTQDLDMNVDLNMAGSYFGLTATATGRMHTTDNDGIFVVNMLPMDISRNSIRITEYDPATGNRWYSGLIGVPNFTTQLSYVGRYIDCATSDINGNGQDELVIAFRGADNHPHLAIVTKGWSQGDHYLYAHIHETGFTLGGPDKSLAVTTGDFDGDGDDEIALAVEDDDFLMTVFIYDVDLENANIIKKDTLLILDSRHKGWNRLDIASGDLDGDGDDEIVATSSYHQIDLIDVSPTTLEMTLKHYVANPDTGYIDNHIATGDLDGDGDDEVVLAVQTWTTQNYFDRIGMNVFNFDDELNMTMTYGKWVINDLRKTRSYDPFGFELAIGNFDAKIDETQAGDLGKEVALVYRTSKEDINWTPHGAFRLHIYDVTADLGLTMEQEETIVQDDIVLDDTYAAFSMRVVVAVGDFDGDSIALGEPDHLVIEGHRDFLAIIAEPPKHIDYIKDGAGVLEELNLSRKGGAPGSVEPSFYTEYDKVSETSVTATDKSGTDYDWGVETDVEAEKDFGIPVVGEIKAKITASAGYDYNNNQEKWNSSYHSLEVGSDLKAVNDDYLVYRVKNIHIWRYPVIGETQIQTKDGKEGQLYVQITIPEDGDDKLDTKTVAGRLMEWYQPVHENGNIFSYPWDKNQIENLGEIKTNSGTWTTGSNDACFSVKWKDGDDTGLEVSSEKKVSVDASISVGGKILNADTKVTVKGHYDKTWSSLRSSETTNSTSLGIKICKPPLTESYAYEFSPFIFENSKSGVLQVDYTVDPLATSTNIWWSEVSGYGGETPDLALNLPWRWRSDDYMNWEFNEGFYNLQMMKGLFFLDSDGEPFGYSIEVEKPVTVRARIYNYSFVDVVDEVEVKFEAQVKTDTGWGDRFDVGTATIPSIEGSSIKGFMSSSASPPEPNWKYVEVTFDTGIAGKYYRFWVTVDPGNKIQEITGHDTGDKYANNEGYFSILLYVTAQSGSTESIPEGDLLFHEVIAISNDTPVEGEEVMISATVSALERDFRHVTVDFYDGDPDEGGKLFDLELIPYIVAGGSYTVNVPYKTNGKVGIHEIYVVIDRKIGEHTYTNNTAMSLLTLTIVIDGCDSEVANILLPTGCSLSDEIAMCAASAENHGKFVSCVSHMTNDLKKDGIITGKEKSAIQSCAAQANIP